MKKVDDFRKHWAYVDTRGTSRLYEVPTMLAVTNLRWRSARLEHAKFGPLL
jgi:hypothetical protein